MSTLNPVFELFEAAPVLAGALNGECGRFRTCPNGEGSRQEYRNSGNEAKKYLKTKEVTLFSAVNYARFVSRFAPI